MILALTYTMMLCSKFIALIAITLKVLFAFIKSHQLGKGIEKERQRENKRERFASLQKTNCQTRYKMSNKEFTGWKIIVYNLLFVYMTLKGYF